MSTLTLRQRRILLAIRELTATNHGRPPTVREIGAAVGLTSTSSVAHQLSKLRTLGLIVGDPRIPRSIRVVGEAAPVPETIRQALDHLPLWAAQHVHQTLDGLNPADLDGYDRAALACAAFLIRVTAARWDHEYAGVAS